MPQHTAKPARSAGVVASGIAVGLLGLIPLAMIALGVARGAFYGLVDHGPYDNAWGGPSKQGAWAAHFAISVPVVVVGMLALVGLAALHRRWRRWLGGERGCRWVLPVTVLLYAGAALLVRAWIHQL